MSGGDAELDALRSDLRVGLGRSFFGDDDGVGPQPVMRIEFGAEVVRYLGEQHLFPHIGFSFGLASAGLHEADEAVAIGFGHGGYRFSFVFGRVARGCSSGVSWI
jgi:hypothetical protein